MRSSQIIAFSLIFFSSAKCVEDYEYLFGCSVGDSTPDIDPAFHLRQAEFIDFATKEEGIGSTYTQISRLVRGMSITEDPIRDAIADVVAHNKGSDFDAIALIRLLYLSDKHVGELSSALVADIEDALLGFRYWLDDPRTEYEVGLTENHQITHHASEFLIGQRMRNKVFADSRTGAQHAEAAKPRVMQWLKDRERFGYSEWLSDTYYGVDITSIVSLIDFAKDEEVRSHATMAMDLLVYDLALNSFKGVLGSTRGRVSKTEKLFDLADAKIATPLRVLFGEGSPRSFRESAGTTIATSDKYQVPLVLVEIARDRSTFTSKQRNGILVEEGPEYGYNYNTLQDAVFWFGMGAYSHPLVVQLLPLVSKNTAIFRLTGITASLLNVVLQIGDILPDWLLYFVATIARPYTAGGVYDRANIVTYRNKHGTLSSTLDKLKGQAGFQQVTLQATLSPTAVVFVTHPGSLGEENIASGGGTAWLGGTSMPRVAQHENVAIAIHDGVLSNSYFGIFSRFFPDYTHAYFPVSEFDVVVTIGSWVIGKLGGGYIALFSSAPFTWTIEGEYAEKEIVAPGTRNVWIYELSDNTTYPSFEQFIDDVSNAHISVSGHTKSIEYISPSQGRITFGWNTPLVVNDVTQSLGPHPRYENPFSVVSWGARYARIERNNLKLELDFDTGCRSQ